MTEDEEVNTDVLALYGFALSSALLCVLVDKGIVTSDMADLIIDESVRLLKSVNNAQARKELDTAAHKLEQVKEIIRNTISKDEGQT